ncbi:MAG: septum formation initiator family protein [Candidatus Paralactobacillus gallistercoris]|uniref:Septum formation initiator family protein n=1 Tax=Candidatus Paralactobacillus gallistercoris TaxID=2838724 RepID=A0A948TKD4_9LACO|nr:septum formation initiator family protein [Candidatus Paralactobacillus gallistercoris]
MPRHNNVHALDNAYVQQQKQHQQRRQRATYVYKIHKRRLLILSIVLLVMLLFFGWQFFKVHRNIEASRAQIQQSQAALAKTKSQNDSLNLEIKQLKDPLYVQKYIRSKYLYSKDGETIYNLPQDNANAVLNKQNTAH